MGVASVAHCGVEDALAVLQEVRLAVCIPYGGRCAYHVVQHMQKGGSR